MVNLEIQTDEKNYDFDFDLQEIAESVVASALEIMECPYDASVNIMLVDNDEIKRINMEQRDIDNATDVLSFPMIDFCDPGDFTFLDSEDIGYFDPDTGELMLGDIIISCDRVVSQAEEYGHTKKREYAFLIAHSMLHLFGFDHMTEEDEKVMFEKQEEVLENIGIRR